MIAFATVGGPIPTSVISKFKLFEYKYGYNVQRLDSRLSSCDILNQELEVKCNNHDQEM
jgi:hypothetical protein